jgi:predicted RNase H-like HicB family nuclease
MKQNKPIIAVGYIKEEEGIYTAICVNMALFGQGKTPEEAYDRVHKAIVSYIKYIFDKHPDEYEKYLNRFAPTEFIAEFEQGIKNLRELIKPKQYKPRLPYNTFIPIRNFAEKVPYAQAL